MEVTNANSRRRIAKRNTVEGTYTAFMIDCGEVTLIYATQLDAIARECYTYTETPMNWNTVSRFAQRL